MKKTLLLTLTAGLVSALPLMASQVDLYVTGSTAFRSQVYSACTKLFTTPPSLGTTLFFGDAAHGGDANNNSSTASWCMSGTPIASLTAISGDTLVIHALFTGSVQGIETTENSTPLIFPTTSTGIYVTNTPTIAFSDVSSQSTPYSAANTANFNEEQVAVQPFVFVKSEAVPNSITNITWEQAKDIIVNGRIKLFSWTHVPTDTSYVYLINRTKDSGTRRTTYAEVNDGFNQGQTTYLFDPTNDFFYAPTNGTADEIAASMGSSNGIVSVVGSAGLNGANLNWGPGYVAGGDVKTEMQNNNAANQAIGYLSLSDAKGITGTIWSQVISYNGVWPTAAGSVITTGTTTTNDFTPINYGEYPFWATEVVVYPTVDPDTISADQDLTAAELGDQTTTGTILGVLDYQTKYSNPGGPTIAGSLENEIFNSESASPGATAIRLSDMNASRASVGGLLTP
jgi:hypothetical protein